jgi:hypothetical protein
VLSQAVWAVAGCGWPSACYLSGVPRRVCGWGRRNDRLVGLCDHCDWLTVCAPVDELVMVQARREGEQADCTQSWEDRGDPSCADAEAR